MRSEKEIKDAIKKLSILASEHADCGDFEGYSDYDAKAYALKWVLKQNGYDI